jgi:hypothetical protein
LFFVFEHWTVSHEPLKIVTASLKGTNSTVVCWGRVGRIDHSLAPLAHRHRSRWRPWAHLGGLGRIGDLINEHLADKTSPRV